MIDRRSFLGRLAAALGVIAAGDELTTEEPAKPATVPMAMDGVVREDHLESETVPVFGPPSGHHVVGIDGKLIHPEKGWELRGRVRELSIRNHQTIHYDGPDLIQSVPHVKPSIELTAIVEHPEDLLDFTGDPLDFEFELEGGVYLISGLRLSALESPFGARRWVDATLRGDDLDPIAMRKKSS